MKNLYHQYVVIAGGRSVDLTLQIHDEQQTSSQILLTIKPGLFGGYLLCANTIMFCKAFFFCRRFRVNRVCTDSTIKTFDTLNLILSYFVLHNIFPGLGY